MKRFDLGNAQSLPRRQRRRRSSTATAVAILSLFAAALAIAGCGSSSTSGGSDGGGETLTLGVPAPISSFDPWSAPVGLNQDIQQIGAAYDSLLHVDVKGKPVPWLATSWKFSGPNVLTLQLRNDVTFSDGSKFDADTVKANFEYAESNKNPGECNSFIEGVKAKVLSPTSVRLDLTTPDPDILTDLGTCAGNMVSPKALKEPKALKTAPSGSGPYVLDEAATIPGQTWTFTRNPKYWEPKAYPFDKVVFRFISDPTALNNAARSGQIDMMSVEDFPNYTAGLPLLSSKPQQFNGIFFLDVDGQLSKPLGNVKVRQAMNYAIDRQALVEALYSENAVVAGSTPFPEGVPGYSPQLAESYPYDPKKAEQLLDEAGYPDGFSVKLLDDTAIFGEAGQAISGYLRKVGINVEISDHPNDVLTQLASGKWPLMVSNFTVGPSLYHTLVNMLGPNAYFNPLHNSNPRFNTLLKEISATQDEAKQADLYSELANAVAEEAWFLAPAFVKNNVAYNSDKVSAQLTPNVQVPFLYAIKPAGS